VGDTIFVITLLVALMCLSYFGIDDGDSDEDARAAMHVVAATLLLAVLTLKVAVVRWWHRMGRFLPALGIGVFTLFTATWLTSAADYLWGW
jgi:hypothetical protein